MKRLLLFVWFCVASISAMQTNQDLSQDYEQLRQLANTHHEERLQQWSGWYFNNKPMDQLLLMREDDGLNLVYRAACAGNIRFLRLFYDRTVQETNAPVVPLCVLEQLINFIDELDSTALAIACQYGHYDVVVWLLKHGAKLVASPDGDTLFHQTVIVPEGLDDEVKLRKKKIWQVLEDAYAQTGYSCQQAQASAKNKAQLLGTLDIFD